MRRGVWGVVVVLPVVGVHAGASLAGNDCSDASPIGSSNVRDGSAARRRPRRWRRWSISEDAHQASAPLPRINARPVTDRRRRPKIRKAPAAVASSQRSASQLNRSSDRSQMLSSLLCSSRFIAIRASPSTLRACCNASAPRSRINALEARGRQIGRSSKIG